MCYRNAPQILLGIVVACKLKKTFDSALAAKTTRTYIALFAFYARASSFAQRDSTSQYLVKYKFPDQCLRMHEVRRGSGVGDDAAAAAAEEVPGVWGCFALASLDASAAVGVGGETLASASVSMG